MANPATPEGKQWLDERSPLFRAENIRTPLMVVQGANDPRVNRAESEQLVIALRDRGFDVEYILAPDEGHGFARPVNNMAMFMAAEKFLAEHLGARYQEGGTPDVVWRLGEIRVDPKTVRLTKKVDVMSVGVPEVVADLRPGKYKYKAKIELEGESMAVNISTEIKHKTRMWLVTDQLRLATLSTKDMGELEPGSLVMLRRSMNDSRAKADLQFSNGKVSGSIHAQGKKSDIDLDIGGPVFGEGPGFAHVIACLPLEEGYSTVFRNFDLQKEKPKAMQLEVVGSEEVEVPAGRFETFRVEIMSAEGGPEHSTVWVSKNDRRAVKMITIMPELGGARLEAELV